MDRCHPAARSLIVMARGRVIDNETEAFPEADRLAAWPHPRESNSLVGHETAEATLASAIGSERLHHAWLISGAQGIGKATFAYRVARFLLSRQTESGGGHTSLATTENSKTDRQIRNLSHPGLFAIRRAWDPQAKKFRQSIAIDDIRSLRHFLQRTPVTLWRVVIVDSADDLNPNSANALLKSLEEPPARTVFLLISSSPGRLLPTIRSRCRKLGLSPLALGLLREAVLAACKATGRQAPDADQLDKLLALSKGSPRRALQLLDGGGLALFNAIQTLLESLPRLDRLALHKLVAMTSGRGSELTHDMAFELLEDTLADAIRAACGGVVAAQSSPQLRRFPTLLKPDNLADWAELWETMREARSETERLNLDKAALTITAFERMQRLCQKHVSGER